MTPLSFTQKILAVVLLIIIIFFALFHLTESPIFQVDQGWAVQVAHNIATTGVDGLQFTPGHLEHVSILTSVSYPLLYALAFWFKLFGSGILQARLLMVLYMIGFVILSFILLRRLYSNGIALASLAILASFPAFYTFGKSVIGEVPVLFFLVLFLLLFNLATGNPKRPTSLVTHELRGSRRKFWLTLAGVSAGLCIVTKTMCIAFIPIFILGVVYALWKKIVTWKEVGIISVSSILPVIVWVMVNFQPGDTVASTLDYYTNPSALTDKTATFLLNLKLFFSGLGPLFMDSFLVIWIIGVCIRCKNKTKVPFEELVALGCALVLTASLLFRYWDARYLFPIQALAILFAPCSLHLILQKLSSKFSLMKKYNVFVLIIVLLSILGLYQLSLKSYIADTYKSTYTADLNNYFSAIPATTTILFYNTPNIVPFFKGDNYYQRIAMFEKWVLGPEFQPLLDSGKVDMLVLEQLSLADEKVSLDGYEKIHSIKEVSIYKRKIK